MRKIIVALFLVALMASPASALFTNGGFESGTTGWTITGDHSVISSFTPQFNNTSGWTSGIPYYNNYSLLLGSGDVGNVWDNYHQSTAFATDTISQDDIDNGAVLYFKWGAILEEPTNGVYHGDAGQPYFSIEISSGATQLYYADHRANQTGFTKIGENATGDAGDIWYGSEIATINLLALGLDVGDSVKINLFVKDCGEGGHGGLVFLDGFGTERPPDYNVPEPATMLLLGLGLMGLAGVRRFKK